MEKNPHDEITAFDTLYTTNHIQKLKILLPYFDYSIRQKLTVYIKYLEFQYTLTYIKSHPLEMCGCSHEKKELNINRLYSDLLPFCTPEEKEKMEQLAGLFRTLDMYREMSQMMEVMKSFAPDGTTEMPFDFSSEMFSNLTSGDFSSISPDMISLFSSFFSSGPDKENSESSEKDADQKSNTANSNGMMDMLMGMLSPEQKTMFEMFGGNNTHESE